MTEESDARIERLEKESQESRAQMSKMMELIRTDACRMQQLNYSYFQKINL